MTDERLRLTASNSRDTLLPILALGHEEVFERLEGLANLLLADFSQVHDFAERAGNIVAATGEEDTASDHDLGGLALEQATLLCILEKVLGRVGDCVRELPAIAQSANLLVSLKQALV